MPKSEPVNFLSRMIDSMLRTLSDGPPSIEAEDLTQVADSLRSTIKSWRKNPPTAPEREDVVRRVISLQAEVRHGSGVVREEVAIRKPDPREDPDSERPRNPEDDRPTIPPGFDMQAYARRMTAPDTEPPSTKRRPSFEIVVDEALLGPSPSGPSTQGRKLSPTNIERAVIGAMEDSRAPMISQQDIEDPEGYVVARYRAGDFRGALDMADVILAETPDNILAQEVRENCHEALARELAHKLGGLDRVPVVLDDSLELECALIDHRASYVLSLVDGTSNVEAILDASGMPPFDALRILTELVRRRVVGFG
jgi:hypothetical protein